MKSRYVGALSAVLILTSCSGTTPKSQTQPQVPKVCSIAPPDGEVAIMAAIDRCRDGSIVRFPAERTYQQANRILIKDRRNLTIDGNGSTFTTSSTKPDPGSGNWVVLRGQNITFQNMIVEGTFDLKAPYNLARYPAGIGWETNGGFSFFGTDGGGVRDATVRNVWGDGVFVAFDGILDPTVRQANWQVGRNLLIERITVDNAARVCLGPTASINNTFRDSVLRNCWMWGVDAEADGDTDGNLHNALGINGLRLLNNTFEGYNFGAIAVPVGGDAETIVGNIEIRGNKILTAPSQGPCQSAILIGASQYSNRIKDVIIEDNEAVAMTMAIELNRVDGGSISNNRIRYSSDGLEGGPEVQCDPGRREMVRVLDSTGIAIAGNITG